MPNGKRCLVFWCFDSIVPHSMSDVDNPYYQRYQQIKKSSARPSKKSPDRLKQDALSATEGWLEQPKDFDWLEKNIPCQAACPAGTDIPGYLDAIAQGRYDDAYQINLRDNVFPAVLGRICTRPCEPACRHGWEGLGEPVAICFSKRSASDFMKYRAPVKIARIFPDSGKKVCVIGSGAAGLSAARELALLGHQVTVLEQHLEPGGMMVQGIPEFRLPRDLVRKEIEQIKLCGVHIECGVSIGKDRSIDELINTHDAVIIAAGTMKPDMPSLPGAELHGVISGLRYLQEANAGKSPATGERVVVIGGGFTAVDCARMAKRLGARDVKVYYRRTVNEMYIHAAEVEEMHREGIVFETQVAPVCFSGEKNSLQAMTLARTEPGPRQSDGRRGFTIKPGSEFTVEADMVLMATGQKRDDRWVGTLLDQQRRPKNLFLAGDFLNGAGSLIEAVASGKSCAREVDKFMAGMVRVRDVGFVEPAIKTGRTRAMDELPRQNMPTLPVTQRSQQAEVETGYNEDAARTEAKRCYLCHYKFEIDNDLCIYCDRCLKVKPVEKCIVKVNHLLHDEQGRITGYVPSTSSKDYNMLYIDQSQCIRCGACRDVCPVECISLQKVSRTTVCAA